MATLTGSTIASTYDRLLALPSGGLNGTTLVAITDGNSSTTCALSVSTISIGIDSTDKFYLDADQGTPHTYLHQHAADKLDIVVGGQTILEIAEAGGGSNPENDYIAIQAKNKLYLDGGTHTYIQERADDIVDFFVGAKLMLTLDESALQVVVNESDQSVDFRVESDNEDEALFLDATDDKLYINKGGTAFTTSIHSVNDVAMTVGSAGVVFNENGNTTNDFRVEGNTDNNLLFCDSSADKIGIGHSAPAVKLDIREDADQAEFIALRLFNTQTTDNTSSSVTLQMSPDAFQANSAKITVGKEQSYASGANTDAFMDFLLVEDNSLHQVLRLTSGGNVHIPGDSREFQLGAATTGDATIYYDGSHMIINPKKVGSGNLRILGDGTKLDLGATANDYTIEWDGSDAVHTITAGDFHFDGGSVGIGDAAPDALLSINQGADNGEILTFKSSDVAHGMYDIVETDSYARFLKIAGDYGGLKIDGFVETGETSSVIIEGNGVDDDDTRGTGARGNIELRNYAKSSATHGGMASDQNMVVISTGTTARFIFDSDGELHSDDIIGIGDDWDEWSDLQMASDLSRLPKAKFDEMMKYSAKDFEKAGLITLSVDDEGRQHAFIKHKAMLMFSMCCFGETYKRVEALEKQNKYLVNELIKNKVLKEKN